MNATIPNNSRPGARVTPGAVASACGTGRGPAGGRASSRSMRCGRGSATTSHTRTASTPGSCTTGCESRSSARQGHPPRGAPTRPRGAQHPDLVQEPLRRHRDRRRLRVRLPLGLGRPGRQRRAARGPPRAGAARLLRRERRASTGPSTPGTSRRTIPIPRRVPSPRHDDTARRPEPPADDLERRYLTREARVRLHQRRFRGLVLTAYRDRCAVCRLHEPRLLDASQSSPTAIPAESRRCEMGWRSARSITGRSTRTWSASRLTTRYRLRAGSSTTRTARCSTCSRASTDGRSSCRDRRRAGPDRTLLAERFERFSAA